MRITQKEQEIMSMSGTKIGNLETVPRFSNRSLIEHDSEFKNVPFPTLT